MYLVQLVTESGLGFLKEKEVEGMRVGIKYLMKINLHFALKRSFLMVGVNGSDPTIKFVWVDHYTHAKSQQLQEDSLWDSGSIRMYLNAGVES